MHKNRTKIVATVGPACGSERELLAMINAGASVFRINGAHGKLDEMKNYVALIRKTEKAAGRPIAILLDLPGPKLRIGKLSQEPITLERGKHVVLAFGKDVQTDHRIPVPELVIARSLKKADRIFLNDGIVCLIVEKIEGDDVSCVVAAGGEIRSKKGLNLPKVKLPIPAMTKYDKKLVQDARSWGVDYFGLSFVRSATDVIELRKILKKAAPRAGIIAKIEKPEALDELQNIIAVSDAIMVARGDLGIEMPFDEIPLLQRDIISRCVEAGKPVITATQMLESMVSSARPTRAEVTDVAMAVWEGTSCVMLSEETSIGHSPSGAVQAMSHIAARAEGRMNCGGEEKKKVDASEFQAQVLSRAAADVADELGARAIVTPTRSGRTALFVSCQRPRTRIFAPTEDECVARKMALYWGVAPMTMPKFSTVDELLKFAEKVALDSGVIKKGDLMVVASGAHGHKGDITQLIEVRRV